jgi:hypothetical protein
MIFDHAVEVVGDESFPTREAAVEMVIDRFESCPGWDEIRTERIQWERVARLRAVDNRSLPPTDTHVEKVAAPCQSEFFAANYSRKVRRRRNGAPRLAGCTTGQGSSK